MNKKVKATTDAIVYIVAHTIMFMIILLLWAGVHQTIGTRNIKNFCSNYNTIEHSFLKGYDKMYCVAFIAENPYNDGIYIRSIVIGENEYGYEFRYALGLRDERKVNEIPIHAETYTEAIEMREMYYNGYTKYIT